jgi:hypothetical protein
MSSVNAQANGVKKGCTLSRPYDRIPCLIVHNEERKNGSLSASSGFNLLPLD